MLVTIDQNPKVTDTVLFNILTPDANGCFFADPYMVDSVSIYFISRDIANGNFSSTSITNSDPVLLQNLAAAKAAACLSPTEANLAAVVQIQNQINVSSQVEPFYFNQALVVESFGDPNSFPAWLSTDPTNSILKNVNSSPPPWPCTTSLVPIPWNPTMPLYENQQNTLPCSNYSASCTTPSPQYGNFQLIWTPNGMREGDYFICWTWTPLPSGEKLSSSLYFTLSSDTRSTTSISSHFCVEDKYKKLLERYTPEMFKTYISPNDLSPPVIQGLNNSVADGFTLLENLSNQMIDLLDANTTSEAYLMVLGNMFGLKLRSDDPTLWRRQIKRAVPLYKKKGTLQGLIEALHQAGVKLDSFTRLWQIVSFYTYQEAFEAIAGQTVFTLTNYPILPIDTNNFELYYRSNSSNIWTSYPAATVSITGNVMTWSGITLSTGDWIRVVYEIVDVPPSQQSIETYIRTLDIADQRDERTFSYPLKNWNVRVIAQNDPMFNSVIPVLNPFYDPLIYGKVRTEFPYSENVYNMDEYNGSSRESTIPCDIDKDFMDYCSGGPSSKYTLDLEIENLSDNRIAEVQEIISQYTPFHSVLHSINLYGKVHDFVQPQIECIETLINMNGEEVSIVNGQTSFNRSMNLNEDLALRRDAAQNPYSPSIQSQAYPNVGTVSGLAQNTEIVLFYPEYTFDDFAIDENSSLTYLEVLSPSLNQGDYTIGNISGKNAVIQSGTIALPLNQSAFTFRLSNEVIRATGTASITRKDTYILTDVNVNFGQNGVKSAWDVANDPFYSGGPWKVKIASVSYNVLNVNPDNSLTIDAPYGTSYGNVSYQILTDLNVVVLSSITGILNVTQIGLVDLGSGTILIRGVSVSVLDATDIEATMNSICVGYYCLINGVQYRISSFSTTNPAQFYIYYGLGNVSGVDLIAYQRVIDMATGYFFYSGMQLIAGLNLETYLSIQNGSNPPPIPVENSKFMENYLVQIGTDYYAISGINGSQLTLDGPKYDWTIAGTSVQYSIQQFINEEIYIGPETSPDETVIIPSDWEGQSFLRLDRRGGDMVQNNAMAMMMKKKIKEDPHFGEILHLDEAISFSIEYAK